MRPVSTVGGYVARAGWLRGVAVAGLCLSAVACIPRLEVKPQVLSGRFAGTTADGQPMVLAFREDQESLRGEGTVGGEPLVLAGAAGWRGVGTLQSSDGSPELVELTLSADGETVTLQPLGQPALVLHREEGPVPSLPSGPFSGRYRALKGRAPLAEVTLVQRGSVLAGAGIVAGDPVGITGRVSGASQAEGVVTYLDGTQVGFEAELSAGGRELTVRGFGEPLTMTRRDRP